MDQITTNKVKLIKWLRGDEFILQHVQSKKLITMDEYFSLKNGSDPGTQITKLLDLILSKGQTECIDFLELLKEEEVNESSPQLKEWITSVNTSEIKAASQSSVQSLETSDAPQSSIPSTGTSVTINASGISSVFNPMIVGSQISGLSMNMNGQRLCIDFLELLKEEEVNESSPQLKEWITSVNTSEIKAVPQNSVQSLETSAASQISVQSSGCSVTINSSAHVFRPSGAQISGLTLNINVRPQKQE
ncbi:hypothetical protein HF521_016591 [Silurus meridionalis]|uniref:CARD domain-containing protein n=1 Tax=Silurus meridionalis TaxID=175797 RepID=A0A8T0BQX2_SILME|nr:hypothetical protein HF521_016591 [Silurus meridionalis]